MSKSKYKIYNGKSLKKLFENTRMILLLLMFSAGIIAGALLLKSDSQFMLKISEIFYSFSFSRGEQGTFNNFGDSFLFNGLIIILNMFLGFSVIGCPFIMLLPLFKGLGIGAVSGYLYSAYKFSGLGYCLLLIYPGAIVSSFALMTACRDSYEYSRNAYCKAIKGKGQYEKDETRVFLSRQLLFLGMSLVSSAIDAAAFKIFSGLFEI